MPVQFAPDFEEQVALAAEAEGLDLVDFVREAVEERMRQNNFARARPLSALSEDDLVREINQGFPHSFWTRFHHLAARRDAGTLTPDEHREIISLSDRMEARSVERLRFLIELSQRRGVGLEALIKQFDLRTARATP